MKKVFKYYVRELSTEHVADDFEEVERDNIWVATMVYNLRNF